MVNPELWMAPEQSLMDISRRRRWETKVAKLRELGAKKKEEEETHCKVAKPREHPTRRQKKRKKSAPLNF